MEFDQNLSIERSMFTSLALFHITARHDDKVTSRLGQGDGAVQTQTRRGACDDNQLAKTNLDSTQHLGDFLFFRKVKLLWQLLLLKNSRAFSQRRNRLPLKQGRRQKGVGSQRGFWQSGRRKGRHSRQGKAQDDGSHFNRIQLCQTVSVGGATTCQDKGGEKSRTDLGVVVE